MKLKTTSAFITALLLFLCSGLTAQTQEADIAVSEESAEVYTDEDFNRVAVSETEKTELEKYLFDLVSIDTSQTTKREIDAARYIAGIFSDEGIDWDLYYPKDKPNRASVRAVLKGNGSRGKPIILLSHLDSVDADTEQWSFDPLKPFVKDGYLYGLGSADDKDLVAINLMVFLHLKRSGVKLGRDVIFLSVADEENASEDGILFLLKHYPAIFRAGYALNEGGGIIEDEDGRLVFVNIAEKQYLDLKISANGASGHSSVFFPSDNSIYKIMNALQKIKAYKFPLRVSDETLSFMHEIYPFQDQDAKTTLDMFFAGNPIDRMKAGDIISENPFFNAQIKDTIVPTVIKGGDSVNALPYHSSVMLNVRLLPTTNPDEFINTVKRILAEDDVEIKVITKPKTPIAPIMDKKDELYSTILSVYSELPKTVVAGGMATGTSDSEHLRRKGIITYGLGSPSVYNEKHGMHAVDERVRLDDFFERYGVMREITRRFSIVNSPE